MTAPFRLHANPRYAPAQEGESDAVIQPPRRAAARAAVTGFEGYRPTPLHRLDGLAETLGIEALWLKDESGRFGLGSFKALGGAYAVVHLLRERLGEAFSIADVAAGRAAARVAELTVLLRHRRQSRARRGMGRAACGRAQHGVPAGAGERGPRARHRRPGGGHRPHRRKL